MLKGHDGTISRFNFVALIHSELSPHDDNDLPTCYSADASRKHTTLVVSCSLFHLGGQEPD